MNEPTSNARGWFARLHRLEDWLLTIFVVALIVLAGLQILLRNVFDGGFTWAEPVLRMLVLWSAMLGALIAARDDAHIGLDFINRFVDGVKLRIARFVALGFAAVLCGAMAWYSWGLVELDREGGTEGVVGIPAWVLELVLPIGFALMAVRFVIRAFAAPKGDHLPEISA
ncbi:MAG TPA: TRAP transporter small permease [Tahibacter sp.]|nr:TRAP transporter small permease [Tahibacter sp.]